jgi:hypothetical protein
MAVLLGEQPAALMEDISHDGASVGGTVSVASMPVALRKGQAVSCPRRAREKNGFLLSKLADKASLMRSGAPIRDLRHIQGSFGRKLEAAEPGGPGSIKPPSARRCRPHDFAR